MCDSIYHVIEPIFNLTIYPVIAYDAVVGVSNFIRFMARLKTAKKEFFSVKLSAAVIAFCAAAGGLYGRLSQGWPDDLFLIIVGAITLLYGYPLLDYIFKKNRTHWDTFLRLPFALGAFATGVCCILMLHDAVSECHSTFY